MLTLLFAYIKHWTPKFMLFGWEKEKETERKELAIATKPASERLQIGPMTVSGSSILHYK